MTTVAALAKRARFVLEVLEAMAGVDGAQRVGMRICPDNPFNDLAGRRSPAHIRLSAAGSIRP